METISDKMKNLNDDSLTVFDIIQKQGPVSKNEILMRSRMKMTKLNRILASLQEIGAVIRIGNGDSTGGRKPILFDMNTKDFFVLGLSIGSIRYTLTVVNLKMQIIASQRFVMNREHTPQAFLDQVVFQLFSMLDEQHIDKSQVLGIGIGSFGNINKEAGRTIRQSSFFLNDQWADLPFREMMQQATGFAAVMDSSANCEVLAHYLYGAGKGSKKLISLTCSMGIRTGIIVNGQLIRSNMVRDDPFGHMTINMDGPQCKCGNYGCVECYSSLSAIYESFLSCIKLGRTTLIPNPMDRPTVEQMNEACKKGDALSCELINMGATALGCGLANYINLFNPDMVILSGLLVQKSDIYYNTAVETTMKRLSYLNNSIQVKIIKADENEKAFEIGGAVLFMEEWINRQR